VNNHLRVSLILVLVYVAFAAGGCRTAQEPALLGGSWDDLGVYKANLVQNEEAALESLQDASVYHLDITIAPDFQTVTGRQQVRYTNRETLDLESVYFRLFPNISGGTMTVSAVTVDKKKADFETASGSSVLKVILPQALKPGLAVTIQLDFSTAMPLTPVENFGLLGYFNNVLALDSFYPMIPVYDERGWHIETPSPEGDRTYLDASFYLVKIKAPSGMTLVASGIEVKRETEGDNQVVTFADGPARDFYLAASNQFTKISTTVGETTVNSYYMPGQQTGADDVLDFAADAIRVFGNRLGAYPYTEFDVIPLALQGGGIGMEYPGIVGIGMGIYDIAQVLETTVVHETGHQWFYNIVGNDQNNQPWLDEAMTQYITGLYYLDTYGQTDWEASQAEWTSFWSRTGKAEIPIGRPVSGYTGNTYGPIVYGRGPLFVTALAEEIGEAKFAECLKQYYEAYKWQIVTTAIYQDYFETCSGKNLDAIFQKWVLPS
jgi:aminopeptidase N